MFVAVHKSLVVTECPEFDTKCEIIWCALQFSNAKPLFLASFYRPPSASISDLEELQISLSKLLSKHRRSHPNVIIGGDFNLPHIDWKSGSISSSSCTSTHQYLLDILLENSLIQLVRGITRPASNNTLDLLLTTNPNLVSDVSVYPGISDHNIVAFTYSRKPQVGYAPPRRIYQFQKADHQRLKDAVSNFSAEFLASSPETNTVDENWTKIISFLTKCMQEFVPSKLSKTRHHLPWITPSIKRQMRKRDKLFKKAHKHPSTAAWKSFRQYRNKVAKLAHQAHHDYIQNVIGKSLEDNPKVFWSYVKQCRTESIGIPPLRHENKLSISDSDKAESLNNYFQSVFTPANITQPHSHHPSPYKNIGHLHIHRPGVVKQLLQLNPSKASGPDEIPPRLLKLVAEELAPSLAFLCHESFNSGIVPNNWKQALVTPIHKGGDKGNPGNYRPISLTCICCKIMEHIILSHISKHLASNNILIDEQHGFRQKLSTTTQLITTTNDWALSLQCRAQTDVIFLDFQKAFDRVSHTHLQTKLQFYGITGDTLLWIMSLLTNRHQAVVVNGSQSSWKPVTSGVPQGSVIGPALFLLYINDINHNIRSKIRLFADDSVIYKQIDSQADAIHLQEDLDTLSDWSKKWLMNFNIKKCAILTITRKRKPLTTDYKLLNESIPRVEQYKYLGVHISKDLRWNTHCQQTLQKANKTLGLLRRTLSPCSKEVKARAYTSLVRPQLEYGMEVSNPYTITLVQQLEAVQRAAARFAYRDYRRTTSPSTLISQLGWDTLHTRRLLAQCTMLHKIQHHMVAIHLPNFVTPASYIARRDHPSKLAVPVPSVDAFKYSFYPRTVWVWNRLPASSVSTPSTLVFRETALQAIRSMHPPPGSKLL